MTYNDQRELNSKCYENKYVIIKTISLNNDTRWLCEWRKKEIKLSEVI